MSEHTMSEKTQSKDLRPGTVMEHIPTGHRVELARRKKPEETNERVGPYLPGWWNTDGSGLADFVIDADSDWRPTPGVEESPE